MEPKRILKDYLNGFFNRNRLSVKQERCIILFDKEKMFSDFDMGLNLKIQSENFSIITNGEDIGDKIQGAEDNYIIIVFSNLERQAIKDQVSQRNIKPRIIKITPTMILQRYDNPKSNLFQADLLSGIYLFYDAFIRTTEIHQFSNINPQLNLFCILCKNIEVPQKNITGFILKNIIKNADIFTEVFSNKNFDKLTNALMKLLKGLKDPDILEDFILPLVKTNNLSKLHSILYLHLIYKSLDLSGDVSTLFGYTNEIFGTFRGLESGDGLDEKIEPIFRKLIRYDLNTEAELFPNLEFFYRNIELRIITKEILLNYSRKGLIEFIDVFAKNPLLYSSIDLVIERIMNSYRRSELDGQFITKKGIGILRKLLIRFEDNIYYWYEVPAYKKHLKFANQMLDFFTMLLDSQEFVENHSLDELCFDNWVTFYDFHVLPLQVKYIELNEISLQLWKLNFESEYENFLGRFLQNKFLHFNWQVNSAFVEFIKKEYPKIVKNSGNSRIVNPINAFEKFFKPNRRKNDFFLFIIVDCARADVLEKIIQLILQDFPELGAKIDLGLSLIPSSTNWARRALTASNFPKNMIEDIKEEKKLLEKNIHLNWSKHLIIHPSKTDFYKTHCELVVNHNEVLKDLGKTKNSFYWCVFNFTDIGSHGLDQHFVKKMIKPIYSTKIRPMISLLLRKYENPKVLLATDHGITQKSKNLKWDGNFQNHYWTENHDSYRERRPRFFVSKNEYTGQFGEEKIVKISNPSEWGLPRKINGDDVYFYIATHGWDLTSSREYFFHGGITPFEMIIPYAKLSKSYKKGIPTRIFRLEYDDEENCLLLQNLSEDLTTNKLKLLIFSSNSIVNKRIFSMSPGSSQKISLKDDIAGGEEMMDFSWYLQYYVDFRKNQEHSDNFSYRFY